MQQITFAPMGQISYMVVSLWMQDADIQIVNNTWPWYFAVPSSFLLTVIPRGLIQSNACCTPFNDDSGTESVRMGWTAHLVKTEVVGVVGSALPRDTTFD